MDMMTRIATLTAECLTSTWPEAAGLPTADEIRGLLAVPPDRRNHRQRLQRGHVAPQG